MDEGGEDLEGVSILLGQFYIATVCIKEIMALSIPVVERDEKDDIKTKIVSIMQTLAFFDEPFKIDELNK